MNTFRKQYRELTPAEKEHIEQIKDAAARLEELFFGKNDGKTILPDFSARARCIALAMTNLEQAVMWAVKAYT